MFISESYIHFHEEISHHAEDDEEFVDISFDWKPLRRHSDAEMQSKSRKTQYLSRSADLLYRNKVANTHDYDGGSDSDTTDTPVEVSSALARCEVCMLEFMHNILDSREHKVFSNRKRKSKRKRKVSSNFAYHHKSAPCIDFDDYKETNEKMELFAPDSERKWTLQYQFKGESPMLTKVIIGRGQKDEYPELNNIHLIQELKDYAQSEWRNKLLSNLKSRNKTISDCFSLIPSVNTCLFCFNEKNNAILHSLENDPYNASDLLICNLDDCFRDLDVNDSIKNEGQQSFDNISYDNCHNNGVALDSAKEKGYPRIKYGSSLNGVVNQVLTNGSYKSKRKVVRSKSVSDWYSTNISKQKVNIEISGEYNDQCSVKPHAYEHCIGTSREVKMDGVVNVILMYADKPRSCSNVEDYQCVSQNLKENNSKYGIVNKNRKNRTDLKNENVVNAFSHLGKSEKPISKSEAQFEANHVKKRRKHARSLSEKLFRRKKSLGKQLTCDDDDDEEFVIIM